MSIYECMHGDSGISLEIYGLYLPYLSPKLFSLLKNYEVCYGCPLFYERQKTCTCKKLQHTESRGRWFIITYEFWESKKLKELFKYENRRAKLRKAGGSHTNAHIAKIYNLQCGECYFCGKTLALKGKDKYVKDHLEAIWNGGTDWPNNIALVCQNCNQKKQTQSEYEFWAVMRKEKDQKWVRVRKRLCEKWRQEKDRLIDQ